MPKKPKPEQWYQNIVDSHTPKKPLLRNCLVAFLSGGLLCAGAELCHMWLLQTGLSQDTAAAWVTCGVIFLTCLATGCGVYDRAGQKCGAGLAVPISGFANSVSASMLEHKYEGLVLGSGCNSFKLAGAVVVFGIASAFSFGLIALVLGLV